MPLALIFIIIFSNIIIKETIENCIKEYAEESKRKDIVGREVSLLETPVILLETLPFRRTCGIVLI